MKPWHLLTASQRADIIDTLEYRRCERDECGEDLCVSAAAAIALLESAAPYGDDELVVRTPSGHHVHVTDWWWHEGLIGVDIERGTDFESWTVEHADPLTPAAASLLEALTGTGGDA